MSDKSLSSEPIQIQLQSILQANTFAWPWHPRLHVNRRSINMGNQLPSGEPDENQDGESEEKRGHTELKEAEAEATGSASSAIASKMHFDELMTAPP